MGSKGSKTTTTNQVSTYQPNAQAAGYITNALDRASQTANLPFAIPQAPVAGFSPDQLAAFQTVRNAQGTAQPYINTAANYFSPDGAQAFYNPMAANVTAGHIAQLRSQRWFQELCAGWPIFSAPYRGLAGVEGLEPPTPGFGDRCSTN